MEDTGTEIPEAKAATNLYASNIIEIIAGTEQKKLYAHAAVLSRSDKFKASIHGDWKDNKSINLTDWDVETVARMIDWLYTGDYPCPVKKSSFSLTSDTAISDSAAQSSKDSDEDGDNHELTLVGALKSGLPRLPKRTERARISVFGLPKSWHHIDYYVNVEHTLEQDNPLPALGKLYILANYSLLPELQNDVYESIQFYLVAIGDLTHWPGWMMPPLIKSVVHLASYVYAHTNSPESTEEPLRKLISTSVAANFSRYGGLEIRELMGKEDDFVRDVWQKVQKQVTQLEDRVGQLKKEAKAKPQRISKKRRITDSSEDEVAFPL